MTEKFTAGIIGSAFGVNGFVKVRSLSGEIEHLLDLQSVIVNKDGEERTLQIEEIKAARATHASPPSLLVHFAGINSPEAAKALTGAQLIVSREQAVPLNEGEFYIEDLKGTPVITADESAGENGGIIGQISDIIEGGGGELVEILLLNGEKRLVPFRKEFFPDISPEKDKIILRNLWILE
ncbi:MAG: ribosome maturation factor RimM [Treponema sp.]|jgi:16S rRNA processing protein RimM|nr:ribosome maturation factor RimM [Treponema sp.]